MRKKGFCQDLIIRVLKKKQKKKTKKKSNGTKQKVGPQRTEVKVP